MSATKNSVKESLMQGYLIVNKKLMRRLGGIEVLFLSYLIDKESYWESTGKLVPGGWFFKIAKEIEKELDIGEVLRKKVHKKLMDLGLIEMKRMGTPNKWYYRICWNQLGEFMAEDIPEEQESALDESDSEDDDLEAISNGTQKQTIEEDSASRGTFSCTSMANKNGPLLPKTRELNLHHPLTPSQARGKDGGNGRVVTEESKTAKPTIDQIRRSWERSFVSESLPAQQDRLPLLRDLMATLKSHDYGEADLPRNMAETVTAHWWSKAKDKKVKESLKERSLKEYDLALADLSDIIEITPAPKIKNNAQKKPKVANEAALASLDALIDQIDQGLLDETEEFYEHMCRMAEQAEET